VTANNHSLDRNQQGFEQTLRLLDSLHIQHTGTFRDTTERNRLNPLIISKNNIRFALLNYTYGTNGFKVHKPNIENYIDTVQIRADIETSKAKQADFIIVILHWGNEYERFPDKEQYAIGEFIRKCGADAVIGSHPHVVQPVNIFRNVHDSTSYFPLVFSLGNFVSNQRDRYRDGGIMFQLDVEKVTSTRVKAYYYMPIWVYKGIIRKKMGYRVIPPFMFDNAVHDLNIGDTDQEKCKEFYNDTRAHLSNIPEVMK
jgi:poly-gamma-glutamate capsule biosynthesis protein CapA/YwtB (metallophosphatase superfamily)